MAPRHSLYGRFTFVSASILSLLALTAEAVKQVPTWQPAPPATYTGDPQTLTNCSNAVVAPAWPASNSSVAPGIAYLNGTGPQNVPVGTRCGNSVAGGCASMWSTSGAGLDGVRKVGARLYMCGPTDQWVPCTEAAGAVQAVANACSNGTTPTGMFGKANTLQGGTQFVNVNSATGKDLYVFVVADTDTSW